MSLEFPPSIVLELQMNWKIRIQPHFDLRDNGSSIFKSVLRQNIEN